MIDGVSYRRYIGKIGEGGSFIILNNTDKRFVYKHKANHP